MYILCLSCMNGWVGITAEFVWLYLKSLNPLQMNGQMLK